MDDLKMIQWRAHDHATNKIHRPFREGDIPMQACREALF